MDSKQFIEGYVAGMLKKFKGTQAEIDYKREVTWRDEAIRMWNAIEDYKLKAIRHGRDSIRL